MISGVNFNAERNTLKALDSGFIRLKLKTQVSEKKTKSYDSSFLN